jgi:hypothetical protein
MKLLFLSLFSLFILSSFSQTENTTNIDIIGGPDFNKLKANNDSVIIKNSAITPFIGLQLYLPINLKNILKVGALYSIKGSQTNNRIDYRNSYVNLFLHYHYYLNQDFSISVGPQYSILLNSKKINGSEKTKTKGYNNFLSAEIGFDYRLQKNVSIGLHYEYPYNTDEQSIWPNLKLKLSIGIDNNLFKKGKERKIKRKENATNQINILKKNVLLVRLRSYKRQIMLAEKNNNTKLKNKIIERRDYENKSIINAFREEFDFCPVYFFYNTDTKKILNGEYKNVFINTNLQKDSSIHFSSKEFLITEFGELSSDTSGGTDFSNYGIHTRDEKLNLISRPFPSFISGYFAFAKRDYNEMVQILNRKLTTYYLRRRKF